MRAVCDAARVAETLGDVLSGAQAPGACAFWHESEAARRTVAGSAAACAAPGELSRVSLKLVPC